MLKIGYAGVHDIKINTHTISTTVCARDVRKHQVYVKSHKITDTMHDNNIILCTISAKEFSKL